MSTHTKIVVLRSKELLYTSLLLGVVLLIIVVLLSLFAPSDASDTTPESTESTTQEARYIPGVYCVPLELGGAVAELRITVDADHINGIELTTLDEAVTTMYPLMEPCLEELAAKVLEAQGVENVSYSSENRYTSLMLLQGIADGLEKAALAEEEEAPSFY